MRWLLLLSIVVVLIGGAGSGSAARHQTPKIPKTPPILVSYNLRATFEASMLVSWAEREGNRNQACAAWAEASGLSKVKARTSKPIKGFLQIFKPVAPGKKGEPPWGTLTAVGSAAGELERTRYEEAGVNWSSSCGDASMKPKPYKWPASTCGKRAFTAPFASLTSSWRVFGTLGPGKSTPADGSGDDLVGLSQRSIDFAVVPQRVPLGGCPIPSYVKALPVDVGLRVRDSDLGALRKLAKNRSYTLTHHYGGACVDGVPRRDCSFVLELEVTLKRTT